MEGVATVEAYTEKVYEHFNNPRNVGIIYKADGVGEAGSGECSDYLVIYIKVNENKIIQEIKFQLRGCAAAIATSSALTEMVGGKHIGEALAVTEADIVDYLGGLPAEKIHCSIMGVEALKNAVMNYLENLRSYWGQTQ